MSKMPPPPPSIQRQINAHKRWLLTSGASGTQIGTGRHLVHFVQYDLTGVDLSLGSLGSSRFTGSSLRNAWLVGTDLNYAIFEESDLTDAHLESANLCGTFLIAAKLCRTHFDGANVEKAVWTKADRDASRQAFTERMQTFLDRRKGFSQTDRKEEQQRIREKLESSNARAEERMKERFDLWRSLRVKAGDLLDFPRL